jgi:hypothetical protein
MIQWGQDIDEPTRLQSMHMRSVGEFAEFECMQGRYTDGAQWPDMHCTALGGSAHMYSSELAFIMHYS